MKTDFLVIGSGAAGLSFALKAAAHGHVTIVTKGEMNECNTNYAQGGICSVTYAPDTFEKHIRDTLVCGAGKCDEAAVELVVKRAPELIRDLIEWGTRFDKTPDGRFELNREGGHTEHRILHHEDLTGVPYYTRTITLSDVSDSTDSSKTGTVTASTETEREDKTEIPATYTVQKGDCLINIAKKFFDDASKYKDIVSLNNLPNANKIYVGQVLKLK